MIDLIAGRQSYRGLKRRLLGTLEVGLMWTLLIGLPPEGGSHESAKNAAP